MFKRLFARLFPAPVAAPATPEPPRNGLRMAAITAATQTEPAPYRFPLKPPELARGIAPAGVTPPVLAMDAGAYDYATEAYGAAGFPGYPYLANLATRAEFRAFAGALSTELTREWIELTSAQNDGQGSDDLKAIEAELKRLDVRGAFQKAAEHDCLFGRSQLFVDLQGHDMGTPLILSEKTVAKKALLRITPVEPMWTTPSMYSALNPAAPDFYRPTEWFMLGQRVHSSRLLTVVTRELPDMLKPAFNFGGMSLSQLAEPYVDNWLRTRQSVSDLINNFSITALATSMDQVLTGADNGTDLFARATLFTQTRSNKGMMLLDKEREELIQINTPLGGLHELQAQSQEQMCSVSRMPAIVLTGISPGGLNASSDSEIRVFYDWIAAQQEAHWRAPLEIIIKLIQLSLFGKIDPDIGFKFVPLYQMTADEEADIRTKNGTTDTAYINAGVLDPSEVRERLARDPNSGYEGLDTSKEIVPPTPPEADDPDPADDDPPAQDEWKEGDHPRADNGQFGKGNSEKIGSGSSGDVFRNGDTVTKSATGNEGAVYAALRGTPGIADGKEVDGKITMPFYKNVVSVDTVAPAKRAALAGLVKKNADRIVSAVNALSAAGYSYNDPLQFGLGAGNKFDLLDFSAVQRDPENARADNLTQLSSFFRTFGQPRIADAVSKAAEHFGMQNLDADSRLVDDTDAKLYGDMDAKLNGPAKFAYYTFNAREVGLSDVAQTPHDGSQKVVLSRRPLSNSEMQQWELSPVVHTDDNPPAQDDWQENKHPRATNGQFGKGGAGPQAPKAKSVAHVDASGNQRSGGLTKRESKIEGNFYRAVDKHTDKLVNRYKSKNGWMIDPDKVKELDPNFREDSNLAGAVHEPSSKLAKIIFKRALEEKAKNGDTTPTVFTAGGSGSGKSTTLPHALKALGAKSAKEGGVIYDSVLSSPKSAKARIDQALAATKGDVAITYTNADIEKALIQNALRSRSVTIDTLMHAHVGASDTLRQLAEHYKDNPRVKFNVMNNRGTIDEIAAGTIADVPEYERFTLRNQLVGVAQGLLDEGAIDQAKFDHLTR